MTRATRIKYWQTVAKESEEEFYRLSALGDDEDKEITALCDLIKARRELDRLSTEERFSWIFDLTK